MGLIGLAATLFLLSLGSYPVVEARIASLPLPSILLSLLLSLLLLNSLAGYRTVLTRQDTVIFAAATFLASWLLLVTVVSSAALGYAVDTHRYVGIAYIFVFPFLALVFRHLNARWLLWALLGGTVLALVIGYTRFFTISGGVAAEHALGYWGIKYLPSTRNSDVLYPVISSLVATGLYATARTRFTRTVLLFITIVSFAAVILSLSRGGWIALSAGYLSLLWITRRQHSVFRKRFRTVGAILLAGIVIATWLHLNESNTRYDAIVDRMQSIFDDVDPSVSNRDRLELAMHAASGILRNPVGVGVGNIAYALELPVNSIGSAENAWLTVGLEGGWPALAAFSLFFFWLFASILPTSSHRKVQDDNHSQAVGIALVAAVFSYLMFNYELNSLFLWSVLAVAMSTRRRNYHAIYRQDRGADGGVQCAGNDNRRIALDSRADPSGGRGNHC
ncbi:MAG TPA: hypothetical protein ENK49_14495 [Gammaproteobacteria bacterium]|nr:hypothetical protein [Gammaproteobacteria bacterium]